MKRTIRNTADGSNTLFIDDLNEGYHSHHGALQEAQHVFIDNGLLRTSKPKINILELGFGTGLNVLVTIQEFLNLHQLQEIHYFTLEKYPINPDEIAALGYGGLFDPEDLKTLNRNIHETPWEEAAEILPNFYLTKYQRDFYQLA